MLERAWRRRGESKGVGSLFDIESADPVPEAAFGVVSGKLALDTHNGSVGLVDVVSFALPVAILLAMAARSARRRVSNVTMVPIVLGGLSALLGAVGVMTTDSVSVG